ncbi:large ribosomal subunit protein bL17m [Bombyx mori]|uniref:Large ribosomal subunit protein bL17m n=1 Tax=Bombyx mori TaxID=7091 RepID=A0A8R2AP52_BOMMO|nr:39S ribosomal protein L17, mitochondrial [Bombyx mori]
MNQAEVSKLVSKLRMNIKPEHRRLKNLKGPEGRIDKLRKTVTGLIKFERIELNINRGDEARQYAERLISEAIRHGDCHKPTMDMANFWLLEKQLVHKLFKVLVPRFENSTVSYTKMIKAPKAQNTEHTNKIVLELRGNPYPDLIVKQPNNRLWIQNVLLDAAKYDYRQSKISEIAANIGKDTQLSSSSLTANNKGGTQKEES